LLAVVKATNHFHPYLYGNQFVIRTDHAALQWLLSFKNPEGQMARWLQKLQQYNFRIEHRSGQQHGNADALSQRPCDKDECCYCEKREVNEEKLEERADTESYLACAAVRELPTDEGSVLEEIKQMQCKKTLIFGKLSDGWRNPR
jgi:hypothetical protein